MITVPITVLYYVGFPITLFVFYWLVRAALKYHKVSIPLFVGVVLSLWASTMLSIGIAGKDGPLLPKNVFFNFFFIAPTTLTAILAIIHQEKK